MSLDPLIVLMSSKRVLGYEHCCGMGYLAVFFSPFFFFTLPLTKNLGGGA